MPVLDSILVAFFCLAFVFVVLASLFVLIRVFSFGVGAVTNKESKDAETPLAAVPVMSVATEADFSSGGLRLNNVDERTAAIIMAIVSDKSGIPLSELCFKSIKQLSK